MDATNLPTLLPIASSVDGGGLDTMQVVLLVLAVGMLTVVMISTRRRMRQARPTPSGSVRERYAKLQQSSSASRDLEQAMLDLDQLSRQVHGRLDTKLARLEGLIRDADARIHRLSKLLPQSSDQPKFEITLQAEDPHRIGPGESDSPADERAPAVFRCADRGMSSIEIAREVGSTPGEVELMLALRKTREQADQAKPAPAPLHDAPTK